MTNCHHHNETHDASDSRRLLLAFGVIATFMVVEIVGGLLSGSLALLADATHMFTDAAALALAVSAQSFSRRPPDTRLHFGYRRAQVLAAFANGVLMTVLLLWIVFEAVTRFLSPVPVDGPLMLGVAVAGLIANIVAFFILHRPDEKNLNIRGAMLHVLGDLAGSVAAIVAAIVIALSGWVRIDPLLSIVVAFLIGISALRLLKDTGFILLEGAPKHINVADLSKKLKEASPVITDIHQVRIWQITPDQPRLTLHACVEKSDQAETAIAAIKACLIEEVGIHYSTVQIDLGETCPDRSFENRPNETTNKSSAKAPAPNAHAPASGAAKPVPVK